MSPPPEQYVIDARPRLIGRAERTPLERFSVRALLPVVDAAAVAVIGVLLALIHGRIEMSAAVLLASIVLTGMSGWDRRDVNYGALEDCGDLTRRVIGSFALAAAVAAATSASLGRSTLMAGIAALPLLFGGRMAARAAQRAIARSGKLSRTLVLGTGETARTIVASLQEDSSYGLDVLGAVGEGTPEMKSRLGTRVLGTARDLVDLVAARRVDTVVVAFDSSDDKGTIPALRTLLKGDVDVWVVPRFYEVGTLTSAQHIGALPVVKLQPATQKRAGWRLKRVLDLAVAGVGLVLTAPLFALIAAAIKLDSKGSVFFRQERIGLDGKPFYMLKFRSMAPRTALTEQTEWEPAPDQITRVGRVLRASGLDELPQLLNVLRGDLTLVGPRPERPVFVKMFDEMYEGYGERHRVPAGITGWAQVHGLRGDTSIEDRARFDNHYIENWSLAADLKIMLLTLRTLLKRYRPQDQAEQGDQAEKDETELADVG